MGYIEIRKNAVFLEYAYTWIFKTSLYLKYVPCFHSQKNTKSNFYCDKQINCKAPGFKRKSNYGRENLR